MYQLTALPILLIGLLALLVGCQRGAAPVAPTPAESANQSPATSSDLAPLGMWRLAIDGTSLEAEATYLPERTASGQGDAFLLPLNRFITAKTFELLEVERVEDQLLVTYRVTHPFAAPSDPTAPSSATNRADLGFAGVVLFLADVESAAGQTFFDGVVANTSMIAKADAYWQPGGMIARTASMTANRFPGLNVVDESGTGNRMGISNGGNPTGNFGSNGWTRSDLGDAPFTGWTGYGVLHQGQAADRTVALNLGTATSISLDVALIAKYTDPRGGLTSSEKQAHRLPSKPADFAKFAYRMPHGALDVSECRVLTPADQLTVTNGEPALIDCEILDWDAAALESTAPSLGAEPDLGRILPGASGPALLEFDCPALLNDPVAGQPLTTGNPYSRYTLEVTTDRIAPDGAYSGLLRMTDPEALQLNSVAYQTISLQVRALGSWAHLFQFDHPLEAGDDGSFITDIQVDQEGQSVVLGHFEGAVNFAPEDGGPLLESDDGHNTFMAGLKPNGDLKWTVRWPRYSFINQLSLSPDGELVYCGLSTNYSTDFDPGPGIDLHDGSTFDAGLLALRTDDGSYAGAVTWPQVGTATRIKYVVMPNRHLLVAMHFGPGVLDLNPGPGTQDAIVSSTRAVALIELDAAGAYLGSALLGGATPANYIDALQLACNARGDIALCGQFEGTLDFDPGPGQQEMIGPTSSWGNPYLLVLDAQGDFKWVHDWDTGGETSFCKKLTVTLSGAIVLNGYVQGLFDADPSDGIALLDQVGPDSQDYLVLLSPNGEFRWAGTVGGKVTIHDLLPSSDSTLLVSLVWSGLMDLDPSSEALVLQADSAASGLLALSTSDGHVVAHRRVDAILGPADGSITMRAIAIAPSDGTLRWVGYYTNGQPDVDPGDVEYLLPLVADGSNGVVLRLNSDGSW